MSFSNSLNVVMARERERERAQIVGCALIRNHHCCLHRRFHGTRSLSVFSSSAQHTTSSPLHSASVQITGFADLVNPNPWKFDLPERREKEKNDPSQDYLSPKKLVELTGESNLHKVSYLEFSINTLENSLGNFGIIIKREGHSN